MNTNGPSLNILSKSVYEDNKKKGFDVAKENIGQSLMLIVSELAEALEADRKGMKASIENFQRQEGESPQGIMEEHFGFMDAFESNIKDTFEDEIADTMIRLFDLCGGLEIDIEAHIGLKRKYNRLRPHRHGKKY